MNLTEKVEIILKEIFGEISYYKLKSFFFEIHNRDVDFIIFTTRRSHLLYCMFRKYFFNTNSKCKYIFDDKAMHFYNKKIKNKVGIVADDIMIHGRALKNIQERLNKKNPKSVEFYVYATGKEPLYNFENMHSKENNLSRNEWEQLSNKIITAIILTSIPYASYAFSYSKKMDYDEYSNLFLKLSTKFKEYKPINLSLEEVDNTTDLGYILNNYLESYIFNTDNFTNENNLLFSCIRIYYNKYLNVCTILPFAITPQMDENTVCKICNDIFSKRKKIAKTNCIESKYRAISSFFSLKILESEFSEPLTSNSWETNSKDICMSYYNKFYSEIIKSIKSRKKISNLKKSDFQIDKYYIENLKNDIYLNTFRNFNNETVYNDIFFDTSNNSEISEIFYKYLTMVNFIEDNLLKKQDFNSGYKEKQKGLSLSVINIKSICSLLSIIITKFDFYAELIQNADTGFLTIFVDNFVYDNKKLYSNFIITGEQVCRLYQNKYIIFIFSLKKCFDEYSANKSLEKFEKLVNYCANINHNHRENIIKAYNHISNLNFNSFFYKNLYKGMNDNDLETILLMGIGKLKRDENEK